MFRYFNKKGTVRLLSGAALLAWGLTTGSVAHAKLITFTTDPGNSTAEFVSTSGFCIGLAGGCDPVVTVSNTPVTFDLDTIGQSFDIMDFLTIAISGPSFAFGGTGTLEAQIAFSAPSTAVSTVASATGTFTSLFVVRAGEVTWDSQPGNIVFDDGTEVSLALSGGSDSCSFRGCRNGLSIGVDATTTLQAVPEPGVLALLSAGLFGFGAVRRFRNTRLQA